MCSMNKRHGLRHRWLNSSPSLEIQGRVEALSDQYTTSITPPLSEFAMRLNVAGIAVGVLAILVFMGGLGQLGPDPEPKALSDR